MSRKIAALLAAVTLAFSAGCSTLADTRAAKGSGQARVYNSPFEQVWNAVPEALKELGVKEEGVNKNAGYVVARSPMMVGEKIPVAGVADNIAIFVDKGDNARQTRVEVVARSSVPLNSLAQKWEARVLDKLSEKLPR
nr:hypothetical protein [uncultured Noviherbaspirillum sp.]